MTGVRRGYDARMTTTGDDTALDPDLDADDDLALDVALPTYPILARFRETADTESDAVEQVVARLSSAAEPHDTVTVERREDDGTWLVVARFVTVSVDAHTAVAGVHDDLHAAGLAPDEVWAERPLA